ncbi:MAG TPA: TolC family protein [Thermoanaerobaculia bacterium]|nr:TolC family protein [Thermoanaerobaculia bacterium]
MCRRVWYARRLGGLGTLLLLFSAAAIAEDPMTLEDVLRESRAANARLPMPAIDVEIAREKESEARAERWLKVAVEGNFLYAPPNGYDPAITNAGEARLQLVGRQPVYDGGARRAAVLRGEAEVAAAGARYRVAVKDLDLEVRTRYSEYIQAGAEAAARRQGIERLENYRTSLKSRQASGQGVASDLLKIDVRLASERASIVDAEGRRESARVALNALMGRSPEAPLSLAPLPPPAPAVLRRDPGSDRVPDVVEAEAAERAAGADVTTARAERRPHLLLTADVGFLGSDTSRWIPADLLAADRNATFGDRLRRDAGYSVGLSLTWPVWDLGAIQARIRQAELRQKSAQQNIVFQKREAARQWAQAQTALATVYSLIQILTESAPAARDAYLEAESRYRGGAATAFEVLESYVASVDAAVRLNEAISRYRIAQALAVRWSEP